MHAPARPRERAPDIHRRAITREETRENERGRPVLRASRAHRAKSRKEPWQVPRDFAHSLPTRRRKVVRVNRAGSPGNFGPHPLHDVKDMVFELP